MIASEIPVSVLSQLPQLHGPHQEYHGNASVDRFFEGWYYRVTLPEIGQSFAFMYSIEDPFRVSPYQGGVAQILGPDDSHVWRSYPRVDRFWAMSNQLALGHWGQLTPLGERLIPQYLDPRDFFNVVSSGYQATDRLNQGLFTQPNGDQSCWCYGIEPVYEYGIPARATMGIFSFLPVFEPGWQILMAHGWATGWIHWKGKQYPFDRAPAYAEKNWGGAFPDKWFWLNCNTFAGFPDLALTSAGARRQVLGWKESVAMISVHWQGRWLEWMPETSRFAWSVKPWGAWMIEADRGDYSIALSGETHYPGTPLLAPTWQGMQYVCRDTMQGMIQLQIWHRRGQIKSLELSAQSYLGGLEVGGGPWTTTWQGNWTPTLLGS